MYDGTLSANMIIALCGLRRCGKDTAANFLVSQHGYVHLKVAEKLKHMVRDLFDFTEEQVETNMKEVVDPRWGVSPRKVMQFFGTEIMQHKIQEVIPGIGRTFFVRSLLHEMSKTSKPIVISDMRFIHEYEMIKLQYPTLHVIEIQRSLCVQDTHASEQEYRAIPKDFVIANNATPEELHQKIREILIKLDDPMSTK